MHVSSYCHVETLRAAFPDSAFAEIKGPANTWDEVTALHDELRDLAGGNRLPSIADEDAERLSPAGRLCADRPLQPAPHTLRYPLDRSTRLEKKMPGRAFLLKRSRWTSLVFENAKPYLADATVVIDAKGVKLFRRELSKYLKRQINREERLIRKIKHEESHRNNLLQLTDMVSGSIYRSMNPKKKDAWDYRKIVERKAIEPVQVWP